LTVGDFARIVGGRLTGSPSAEFEGFCLDSRAVEAGSLFLAIAGKRHDGHDHAEEAIRKGCVAAVVERPIEGPHVLVDNLVEALARLGSSFRDRFSGPVIGITGSNGKTSTKEFAAAACSPLGPVLKSPANHNTEYTAPLVWTRLRPDTAVAVVEMGMRGFGQIAHLCRFSRPTIGVITMIGTAHVEMVGSREGIVQAKTELFDALPEDGVAILWAEDDFAGVLRERAHCPVRTFGFSPDAECRVLGYRALSWDRCLVRGQLDGRSFEAELPTVGRHQALNAAAAVLAAHSAGVAVEAAAESLAHAELPPLRMEVRLLDGATLLVDTYNASPDSTVAAIRTLSELPANGRRIAIIGEMRELGDLVETGHRQVGRAIGEANLDRVVLYGEATRFVESEAVRAGLDPSRVEIAHSLDEVRRLLEGLADGDVALMKGSRSLEMETAVPQDRGVSTR
jgi:UDP-N-acetylmuramoyl-tripeptide--D-alanyl-D-alanine ligase